MSLSQYIDLSQQSLVLSAATIAFNPLFWNIVARQGLSVNTTPTLPLHLRALQWETDIFCATLLEYNNHFLTKIFGNKYNGCYFLAVTIFSLGIIRDHLYNDALKNQPYFAPVHQQYLAYGLFATGNVLVLSSMWALGITGTYLGDYFGILMDAPVTGFPFNITSAPMYWGSTMSFLAVALYHGKPAGLLLTAEVFICYKIACLWEEPFTVEIYSKRDRERPASKKAGKAA
ncbi:Phosphatidyl-N-methylethanolamine N-methyltransferase [Microsporum audouinii]